MNHEIYQSPLSERYASKEMQYVFSPEMKFKTWRRLWIALAETEQELGLDITDEQIAELKAAKDDINYDVAKKREKEVRHDQCYCRIERFCYEVQKYADTGFHTFSAGSADNCR